MVRRRGIARGRLFRHYLPPGERLDYVRGFFDWLYRKRKSERALQEEALAWWIGLTPEQVQRKKPQGWNDIIKHTDSWPWSALQMSVREKAENIFLPRADRKELEPITATRRLGIFTAPDGERYWYYHTDEFLPDDWRDWPEAVIDRTLLDLLDLNVNVVWQCEECRRLFVRRRPSVGRFCSSTCRTLNYLKEHGYKPPGKMNQKQRSKTSEAVTGSQKGRKKTG